MPLGERRSLARASCTYVTDRQNRSVSSNVHENYASVEGGAARQELRCREGSVRVLHIDERAISRKHDRSDLHRARFVGKQLSRSLEKYGLRMATEQNTFQFSRI